MDKPQAYVDLHSLEEDKRIDLIGHTVTVHGKTVAVVTDSDPGKAERYIAKLTERWPGCKIIDRFDGPTPGTVTFKVGPISEPT